MFFVQMQRCIWQKEFHVSKLKKMPDKISRLATSFVQHSIYFKTKTGPFSEASSFKFENRFFPDSFSRLFLAQ